MFLSTFVLALMLAKVNVYDIFSLMLASSLAFASLVKTTLHSYNIIQLTLCKEGTYFLYMYSNLRRKVVACY